MEIVLNEPDLEAFVDEQVQQGRYASRAAVVQAALACFKYDLTSSTEIDDETLAGLERAAAQLDRGEGKPIEEVAAILRKRIAG